MVCCDFSNAHDYIYAEVLTDNAIGLRKVELHYLMLFRYTF